MFGRKTALGMQWRLPMSGVGWRTISHRCQKWGI